MARTRLGLIVGNRDVFPAELALEGRREMLALLERQGIEAVALPAGGAGGGVVTSWKDAEACAALFRGQQASLDGILVTLPNFGDERAVADTIRFSGLAVPVLVHAWPDRMGEYTIEKRRDAFCGKLSVCNNLKQYAIPYSVGRSHVVSPASPEFAAELTWFADVCRVVRGLRGSRIGSVGERTIPFKTVRYSEKLLEASGISVESRSLLEVVSEVQGLPDSDPEVAGKLARLGEYLPKMGTVPPKALSTTAKLVVVLERWAAEYRINALALQCWSAMQGALGIFPCAAMSMMSDGLLPSACEVDVMGAVAMYALQLAGGSPTALFDWNNNYGEDPGKVVLFHCSNTALSFLQEAVAGYNAMAVKGNPLDSCYCTLHGKLKPGAVGWLRLLSDDTHGRIIGCLGDGEITEDPLQTFGTTGVMKVADLPGLMSFLAREGFEHHVALSYAPRTRALQEALGTYLGWTIHRHGGAGSTAGG
jgi:L-fucose isomerase-like protein